MILISCNKEEEITPPKKPTFKYEMTAWSNRVTGNNFMRPEYYVDFHEQRTDTVWITHYVEHWEREFELTNELFEPKIVFVHSCSYDMDSLRGNVWKNDTLVKTYIWRN